jgi:hypothetical protein
MMGRNGMEEVFEMSRKWRASEDLGGVELVTLMVVVMEQIVVVVVSRSWLVLSLSKFSSNWKKEKTSCAPLRETYAT